MQYARWATKEEIKERLYPISKGEEVTTAGVPLMYDNDTMYIDKGRSRVGSCRKDPCSCKRASALFKGRLSFYIQGSDAVADQKSVISHKAQNTGGK